MINGVYSISPYPDQQANAMESDIGVSIRLVLGSNDFVIRSRLTKKVYLCLDDDELAVAILEIAEEIKKLHGKEVPSKESIAKLNGQAKIPTAYAKRERLGWRLLPMDAKGKRNDS